MIVQTGRIHLVWIHINISTVAPTAKTIWEIPVFHVLQQEDWVMNGIKHPQLTSYTA